MLRSLRAARGTSSAHSNENTSVATVSARTTRDSLCAIGKATAADPKSTTANSAV